MEATAPSSAPAPGDTKEALFCPIGRALDLIGERWTLVLIRHLLGGNRGFQQLRVRTGIAPRVLSTRLRQLIDRGFVQTVEAGSRSQYGLTELGRSLAPIVRSIGRWWVLHVMEQTGPFSQNSAASVVESLPVMLREERARGTRITYELRLTGAGGGVWTVEIENGACRVREGFANRADVRYTAGARDWCALALGLMDDREAFESGRLIKDGHGGSLAWYFYQPAPQQELRTGDDR